MIKEWIGEYDPKNTEDVLSALREIMQEVVSCQITANAKGFAPVRHPSAAN